MTGFQIKENLREGRCVVGTHILSLMNPTSAALAAEMAMDFAFICTEHIPLGRTEVGMMCQYYLAKGISPIVRVPSPDPVSIATMLDGGAECIVVPYVETVEEVRRIVGAVKYRPIKGQLLHDWIERGIPLPEATSRYLETFNRNTYVIIGVESVPAIERLDELLAVPGVDAVFLGPHDITTSMGIPTASSVRGRGRVGGSSLSGEVDWRGASLSVAPAAGGCPGTVPGGGYELADQCGGYHHHARGHECAVQSAASPGATPLARCDCSPFANRSDRVLPDVRWVGLTLEGDAGVGPLLNVGE